MNSFRPEFHIAQQSRRDKLRIQQDTYANNFPLNYDSSGDPRSGTICYDPSEFCSQMINFSVNPLLKDALLAHHEPLKEAPFPTSFTTVTATDAQYFTTWKTLGSQSNTDWVANHSSIYNPNPISALDVKPSYLGYDQDASSLYQNVLQELVTSSTNVRSFGLEFASLRQKASGETGHGVGGSELLLLPDQMRLNSQWSSDLHFAERDYSNTQALSLSLSSVPPPKVHETNIADRGLQTKDVCGSNNVQDSILPPNQNVPTGSRNLGEQALTHWNPGPLGPFTGYAAILRSSRFLKPAQQMLEELCCIAGSKDVKICDISDEILEEVRVSSEGATNDTDHAMGEGNNSGVVSSFVMNDSSDKSLDASCSLDANRPERKAKLLFMQDEVGIACRALIVLFSWVLVVQVFY